MRQWLSTTLLLFLILCLLPACSEDDDDATLDGDDSTDGDTSDDDDDDDDTDDDDDDTDGDSHYDETVYDEYGYPTALPFDVQRENVGEALSDEEVAAFTKAITGMMKDTGYWDWVWWVSHGQHESFDENQLDYKLWWQDTKAIKEGDTITFSHYGGADNLTLRTCKTLNNAIAGYMATGDEMFKRIVIAYSKGLVALSLGMEYGDDPVKYLQARAIFTNNHEYDLDDTRHVKVDYDPAKVAKEDWNAHTIPNTENREYGSGTWLRTMRSKDDVPHMYRTVPLLMRVAASAPDDDVREAAAMAYEYLKGFAKDVVDQGYQIRTIDQDGNVFVPVEDNGVVKDLASFNRYDLIDAKAECTAKIGSALIAYGDPQGNDCGVAGTNKYEKLATVQHYFNQAIVRQFHVSALSNALMNHQNEAAEDLMNGLILRADWIMEDPEGFAEEHAEWRVDQAGFYLAAGTVGLPLTNQEARSIVEQYTRASEFYRDFPYWDPWDESVPDGEFAYVPSCKKDVDNGNGETERIYFVREDEIPFVMEYCWSPLRNPNSARFVDCDIVLDPSRWGE